MENDSMKFSNRKQDSEKGYRFNQGIWFSRDGKVYEDPLGEKEIIPSKENSKNAYYYIPGKYLDRPTGNAALEGGYYLHRMLVYTFGDRNGKAYYQDCVIDHVNMDHSDNRIDNLEIVTDYINLARAVRAYPKDYGCRTRYENAMTELKLNAPETYDVVKAGILEDCRIRPIPDTDEYYIPNTDDDDDKGGDDAANTVCLK